MTYQTPRVYVTATPETGTYVVHCPELGVIREMIVSSPSRCAADGQTLVIRRTAALLALLQANDPQTL